MKLAEKILSKLDEKVDAETLSKIDASLEKLVSATGSKIKIKGNTKLDKIKGKYSVDNAASIVEAAETLSGLFKAIK